MTTEVLRNMLYADSSALDHLDYVVLDEVHYLQDTYRGPVWEEVIVHLPARRYAWSACRRRSPTPRSWRNGSASVRGPTDLVVETSGRSSCAICTWSAIARPNATT